MAKKFYTLEYQAVPGVAAPATRKAFSDWGFVPSGVDIKSQACSTITLSLPLQDISADPIIPYYGWIVIRINEVKTGPVYAGGTIVFQGVREFCTIDAKGQTAAQVYTFVSPWRQLEQLCYKQGRQSFVGVDPAPPHNAVIGTTFQSDLYLFQGPVDNAHVNVIQKFTTGQQIADVIAYAASRGVPIAGGINGFLGYAGATTIDPMLQVPIYPATDVMCSEVIQNALKSSPDCVVYFDFSSYPPVLNVRQAINQASYTATMKRNPPDNIPRFMSATVKPRDDLQVPSVWLYYKYINTVNSAQSVNYTKDFWPPGSTGDEVGALVQTIDMAGSQVTSISVVVNSIRIGNGVVGAGGFPANPADGTNLTRLAFWQLKHAQFRNANTQTQDGYKAKFQNLVIGQAWIEDENGIDITVQVIDQFPGLAAVLQKGAIASWMRNGNLAVVSKRCTVKASIGYDEYSAQLDPNGKQTLISTVSAPNVDTPRRGHEVSCSITLVNFDTGGIDQAFTTEASVVTAEPQPIGLAQSIWTALNQKQYDGTITFKEDTCSWFLNVGYVLNLIDGPADWAQAKMLIQGVSMDFTMGTTTVQVGPAKHLGAKDLISLFLFNRFRLIFRNPLARNTGEAGSSGATEIPSDSLLENTVHQLQEKARTQLVDRSHNKLWMPPSIDLNSSLILAVAPELQGIAPPVQATMKPTRVELCNPSTGTIKVAVILSTDQFDPAK